MARAAGQIALTLKRWTRVEYERLVALGVFAYPSARGRRAEGGVHLLCVGRSTVIGPIEFTLDTPADTVIARRSGRSIQMGGENFSMM